MTDYRRMLMEVQKQDFSLQEAALFLDTHENNRDALKYFNHHRELADKARREFENKYGPLQISAQKNIEHWEWTKAPWPWECEDCNVGL